MEAIEIVPQARILRLNRPLFLSGGAIKILPTRARCEVRPPTISELLLLFLHSGRGFLRFVARWPDKNAKWARRLLEGLCGERALKKAHLWEGSSRDGESGKLYAIFLW